jgi:hypothetical protein
VSGRLPACSPPPLPRGVPQPANTTIRATSPARRQQGRFPIVIGIGAGPATRLESLQGWPDATAPGLAQARGQDF